MIAVVDEEMQGDLDGVIAADARCAEEGAAGGVPGNWRAMLSTSSRDLRDVVSPEDAGKTVVNLEGETLFPSWTALFSNQILPEGAALLRFDGEPHEGVLFSATKADVGLIRFDGQLSYAASRLVPVSFADPIPILSNSAGVL